MNQRVVGGVGRRQDLDVETLEYPARAEFRLRQTIGDPVVDSLRRFAAELLVYAEDVAQLVRQPHARRRAAKQMEVFGEGLPDFAVVGLHRAAVNARYAERFHRDALRVEHPENVVVGNEQQISGRAEWIIRGGEHPRINMAMRADQRLVGDLAIETQRDLFLSRIWIEISVFREMDFSGVCHRVIPCENDDSVVSVLWSIIIADFGSAPKCP